VPLGRHKARLINGEFGRMFYGQPRMNGKPEPDGQVWRFVLGSADVPKQCKPGGGVRES